MVKNNLNVGVGKWTPHAKQIIAASMYKKGEAFVAAALLLRQKDAYEYAVLHLICQGIEVLGKGYLLSLDYDKYSPELRTYGHDVFKLISAIQLEVKVKLLRPAVSAELTLLNNLYKQHLLRYGSGWDILTNPATISSMRVLSRCLAALRLAKRHGTESAPKVI